LIRQTGIKQINLKPIKYFIMKKFFLALVLFISIGVGSAFATDETVSPRVLKSFKQEFSSAKDVSWIAGSNYYRAAFTINDQNVFAYYNFDGELLSIARHMSSLQLPIKLLTDLKNDYTAYWISDVFEVSNAEGTHYYVTLEDSENKLMLKSSNNSNWTTHSKNKKI
jgi:hypothetical protein